MANSKISALTSASTPLAGTETLPIVQSGATKQVSVANLTAGRAVSATSLTANVVYTTALAASPASTTQNFYIYSSSGLNANAGIEWQYATAGSGYGFKMNVNGGTDTLDIGYRANSATWTKTFGFGNDGNLVPFVAAKGINFTANTPLAGMTSQLLNWYEEGTYTPTATNLTVITGSANWSGKYTRVGRLMTVYFIVTGGNFTITQGSTTISLPKAATGYETGLIVNPNTSVGNYGFQVAAGNSFGYVGTTATGTGFAGSVTYIV